MDKVKECIEYSKLQNAYSNKLGTSNNNELDDTLFLEVLLIKLKGFLFSYSSYKKKEQEKFEVFLINEITFFQEFQEEIT